MVLTPKVSFFHPQTIHANFHKFSLSDPTLSDRKRAIRGMRFLQRISNKFLEKTSKNRKNLPGPILQTFIIFRPETSFSDSAENRVSRGPSRLVPTLVKALA